MSAFNMNRLTKANRFPPWVATPCRMSMFPPLWKTLSVMFRIIGRTHRSAKWRKCKGRFRPARRFLRTSCCEVPPFLEWSACTIAIPAWPAASACSSNYLASSFARFTWSSDGAQVRRSIFGTMMKIVVPTMLLLLTFFLGDGIIHWSVLLFVDNLVEPSSPLWWEGAWFVQVLFQILLFMGILTIYPQRWLVRSEAPIFLWNHPDHHRISASLRNCKGGTFSHPRFGKIAAILLWQICIRLACFFLEGRFSAESV